jgi:hypothetical protein
VVLISSTNLHTKILSSFDCWLYTPKERCPRRPRSVSVVVCGERKFNFSKKKSERSERTVMSFFNNNKQHGKSSVATPKLKDHMEDEEDEEQRRIHFLSALGAVPVPFLLLTGMPIYTVSANGKTQPATLTFSVDRFTAYIRHDQHHSNSNNSSSSAASGGGTRGGGLSRAGSEKSLGGGMFSLSFRDAGKIEQRAIDIGEMDRVQRGQSTQQFEQAKKHVKADNNKSLEVLHKKAELQRNSSASSTSSLPASISTTAILKLDPALSFSIIFRGAHTLDLMAQAEKDRDIICNTLDQILRAYQRGKSRVSTDILLLRYVWLDVDKSKTGYVTVHQFWQALQAINFNKKQKDVAQDYEKFGRIIGLDKSSRKRGLTFEQSATFLHKVHDTKCSILW